MKIAVASIDGQTISPHFGHAESFVVFEIGEKGIEGREVRSVTAAHGPAKDAACAAEAAPAAHHGHGEVLTALADCVAVLCGGMGANAAKQLQSAGIRPIIVADATLPVDEAMAQLIAGTLMASEPHACCCGHQHGHGHAE